MGIVPDVESYGFVDALWPKTTMIVGLLAQAVIGFIMLELCVHGSSPDHLFFVLVCARTILSYGSSRFFS